MSTRVIENPRDRLITILIAPLMACSARIPVYAMVTALMFPQFAVESGAGFHRRIRDRRVYGASAQRWFSAAPSCPAKANR